MPVCPICDAPADEVVEKDVYEKLSAIGELPGPRSKHENEGDVFIHPP